jgi:hypothetical protein
MAKVRAVAKGAHPSARPPTKKIQSPSLRLPSAGSFALPSPPWETTLGPAARIWVESELGAGSTFFLKVAVDVEQQVVNA